jgi:hypothetical protein
MISLAIRGECVLRISLIVFFWNFSDLCIFANIKRIFTFSGKAHQNNGLRMWENSIFDIPKNLDQIFKKKLKRCFKDV